MNTRCAICKARHHVKLHLDNPTTAMVAATSNLQPAFDTATESAVTSNELSCNSAISQDITNKASAVCTLLPTVILLVQKANGDHIECRALLDSGSQANFITKDCFKRLRLPRRPASMVIKGIASSGVTTSGMTVLQISSKYDSSTALGVDALIIDNLPDHLPGIKLNTDQLESFQGIQLADPEFDSTRKIDVLLGAEWFFKIVKGPQIQSKQTEVSAVETVFGWILAGQAKCESFNTDEVQVNLSVLDLQIEENLGVVLRGFWETEEIQRDINSQNYTQEEEMCENMFRQSYTRNPDGRFKVKIPFKDTLEQLGKSLGGATRRFLSLEKQLERNPSLKQAYEESIDDYLSKGYL